MWYVFVVWMAFLSNGLDEYTHKKNLINTQQCLHATIQEHLTLPNTTTNSVGASNNNDDGRERNARKWFCCYNEIDVHTK